jgi:hypothetical protein
VSKFAKTGIYSINPSGFSEENSVSGEVPTTVTATVYLEGSSPIRGCTGSGHERVDNGSSRDIDSGGGGVTIAVILQFPSISVWQIQNISRPITSPKL